MIYWINLPIDEHDPNSDMNHCTKRHAIHTKQKDKEEKIIEAQNNRSMPHIPPRDGVRYTDE